MSFPSLTAEFSSPLLGFCRFPFSSEHKIQQSTFSVSLFPSEVRRLASSYFFPIESPLPQDTPFFSDIERSAVPGFFLPREELFARSLQENCFLPPPFQSIYSFPSSPPPRKRPFSPTDFLPSAPRPPTHGSKRFRSPPFLLPKR